MWTKLDDGILDNLKIAKVGLIGFAWFTAGLVYCNRNLTDGFIPYGIARDLFPLEHVDHNGMIVTPSVTSGMSGWDGEEMIEQVVGDLLAAGLWDVANGGYTVHDFLQFNPSRATVLAQREATKERVRKWRSGVGNAVSNSVGNTAPVPDPVPVPKSIKASTSTTKVTFHADHFDVPQALVELWVTAYPGVDVPLAIIQAHAYFVANPEKRKSNWQRTLVNWLKREQDRNPRPKPVEAPVPIRAAIMALPDLTPEQVATNRERFSTLTRDLAARKALPA